MLTKQNQVKLCDLGLARQMGKPVDAENQQAVGTPHYISPEQAKGIEEVDARSDIYSLGATLYHLIVGEPPFSGSSPMVVMTKHLTDPVVPPIKRNPKISPALNSVIMKMMSKRKEDRYQSTEELSADLQDIQDGKTFQIAANTETVIKGKSWTKGDSEKGAFKKTKDIPAFKLKSLSSQSKHEKISLIVFVILITFLLGSGIYVFLNNSKKVEVVNPNPRDNEKAWQLLDEAASFQNLNPKNKEEILQRYKKVFEVYPGTEAAKYAKQKWEDMSSE
jgi:serine/threonine-protein kinase